MKDTRREQFKSMLYAKRSAILAESARGLKNMMTGEHRAIIDESLDYDDMPFFCQSEHMQCRKLNYQRDVIKRIDTALGRLEQGTYGMCEECGDEIGEGRLKLIPFATHCRECQEAIEFEKNAEAAGRVQCQR